MARCPLLALSGHFVLHCICPLSEVKADMTFCGNPLLRSLLGVKRTSLFAAQMSVGGSRQSRQSPQRKLKFSTSAPFGIRNNAASNFVRISYPLRRQTDDLLGDSLDQWIVGIVEVQNRACARERRDHALDSFRGERHPGINFLIGIESAPYPAGRIRYLYER